MSINVTPADVTAAADTTMTSFTPVIALVLGIFIAVRLAKKFIKV